MRYIDEYRDPLLARALTERIAERFARIGRPVTIMEVCGSHTRAIGRYGIRTLLPEGLRLLSGPGCPVCVTAIGDVDAALWLAGRPGVVFATFGDMMRVPGTGGADLQRLRATGADVRPVASALDALTVAGKETERQVVFLGIGFETTAPTVASVLRTARSRGIANFSVFSVHKVIPPALRLLLADSRLNLDGFLCPGHVSTIIGSGAYALLVEAGKAAVITGFEPVDILEGIDMILGQIESGRPEAAVQYKRGVSPAGNPRAIALMEEVFETGPASWRGLGTIPGSGLSLRPEYGAFDARKRFSIPEILSAEFPGCACGEILRGIREPSGCPLFARVCTPADPVGPCMVSSEGTCAARYRYG
ncbi:MAG TPA: hydrogenase formation protein HypD [Syntrophales bacterium]|mgnify:CR=1 FL=1|nr:hydrogenase formation protein HypD [Syntrophales bacterium]